MKRNVSIFVFDKVDILDVTGPFEVFSLAEYDDTKEKCFNVRLITETSDAVTATHGFRFFGHETIRDFTVPDILIIPGGYGAEQVELKKETVCSWIKNLYPRLKTLASVCTGVFILTESGVLSSGPATTHWMDQKRLAADYPALNVLPDRRFVENGRIITSGGISAGIDMSLQLVTKYISPEVAKATAKRLEYSADEEVFYPS